LYVSRQDKFEQMTSKLLKNMPLEMGILVSGDGEVEQQSSDSASASVVLGCVSCSLKVRLVINETS